VIPYTATFLVFSDYMRPPLRLAALMKARVIFIFTHDSIAMGEDGPTHQPVEQLISLRAIPGLTVLRPADANETAEAWRVALEQPGPSVLVLTRQKLPVLDPQRFSIHEGVRRGAYVLAEAEDGSSDVVLIGTGSEVHLALAARERLAGQGVRARVVSMPSWELFDAQPPDYREAVVPPDVPALAVEAGSPRGWRDYVGDRGDVIGLNRFGASAPGPVMLEQFGFTAEHIAARARTLVEENRDGRRRKRPATVAPKS
jgi:transketolase